MEWWKPKPGFEARDWKQELVVIVPPDHPCPRFSEIDRETLAGMTLLGAEPGIHRLPILAAILSQKRKNPDFLVENQGFKLAEKEGFEPSKRY